MFNFIWKFALSLLCLVASLWALAILVIVGTGIFMAVTGGL